LTTDGSVYCLGTNYQMQCGIRHAMSDATTSGFVDPTRVIGIPPAVGLWASDNTTCVIGTDQTVWCWGGYAFPVARRLMAECLDLNNTVPCSAPIQVPILHGAKQLALGKDHGCAIMADNHILCWGDNTYGQLGQ
jgi:alpha-tubulin suppressor-like RCC1 family protein